METVLVSGAVAVKGEGVAREGAACCCWDISEPAPPMLMAPDPEDDPSVPEKTPKIKLATLSTLNAEQCKTRVLQLQLASAKVGFRSCTYITAILNMQ